MVDQQGALNSAKKVLVSEVGRQVFLELVDLEKSVFDHVQHHTDRLAIINTWSSTIKIEVTWCERRESSAKR